ncbi:3284_t:CDS:2 [Racocetra persica]|uniref:3284_t:CDS:1 n=1 Tax=Racocetra persica TaxID=160502 RepID=A0ACA9LMB1_9GLOM|nr:3284_t:CDS:2 [Racocetra persica]
MIHRQQHSSRCLRNGTCIYHYPKPIILETYIDEKEYYEQYLLYPFKQQDICENDFLEQKQTRVLRKIVRKRTTNKITRIVLVAPGSGKLFYLRNILIHRAIRTWDEIKILNNITYSTYQETAREMGLFTNNNESMCAMKEAVENFSTPAQLRFLFLQLILDSAPVFDIWQKFNSNLSADIQEQFHGNHSNTINIAL